MSSKIPFDKKIKIEVPLNKNRGTIFDPPSRKAKGILSDSFQDEFLPRRMKNDDDGGGGGDGGGGTLPAPTLTIFQYNTYIVSQGVYEGYGYVQHFRYNSASVDTNRPFAQKLQFEVSRNADFSDPHQTAEYTISSNPGGYNHLTANRKFTCSGETFQYGIRGTTQYLRVRDYNGTVWSPWASIELVFPADYATPPEYPLEFTESCN